MMNCVKMLLAAGCCLMVGCRTEKPGEIREDAKTSIKEPIPPMAKKIPKSLEKHGHVRNDEYYWLRERENPEVIAYLEAENAYTEAMMAHTDGLEDRLFEEIKGRIKQSDESVPYKLEDYYYYSRYEEGKQYPIYCRKKGSLEAEEEIMLDGNKMAEGQSFFNIGGSRPLSLNQNILAYSVDTVGRRIYTIHFKNLETGETYPDVIPEVTGNMTWANDDKTLFYSKQDPVTLRPYQIYRHELGTDPSKDVLVYQENDDTFRSWVWKTKSKKYIIIGAFQTLSNEYRFLDAANPTGELTLFLPREREHEYQLDHYGDHFYMLTNLEAQNFRLMRTRIDQTDKSHWQEVIPHRENVLLDSVEIFKDYLVLAERKEGLIQLRVKPWQGTEEHYLDFGEPAYRANIDINVDFDTPILRYGYTSLTTPFSTYDYNMATREKALLKQEEVLGGFDSADYKTERLMATARDGVKVPISLVYRKGMERNGKNNTLLYGYGSYGATVDASFRSSRLSLIDRGFIFAIAHIRGGQMLGRPWYDEGKLFKKMNTFTDFVDCAQYLIEEKYTSSEHLFAQGGSAGGLLMGAVVNMAPELFRGVVAAVPFVDVITTMLDDSIPLTTGEYDEWGDPNQKDYYDYILAYSPYDNVEAKNYPNLLVTTGLHDSQVQYWEPAKWVARLRDRKTDKNRLLLKTNMDAGHGGASGRFDRYKEIAFEYAFILDLAGIHN